MDDIPVFTKVLQAERREIIKERILAAVSTGPKGKSALFKSPGLNNSEATVINNALSELETEGLIIRERKNSNTTGANYEWKLPETNLLDQLYAPKPMLSGKKRTIYAEDCPPSLCDGIGSSRKSHGIQSGFSLYSHYWMG